VSNIPANLDAWLARAKEGVGAVRLAPVASEIGRVETVADGIAVVSGLRPVRLDELIRFEQGQTGFALTLDHNTFSCVLLDDIESIEAGHQARGTGEVVRVPVGPPLLGRVVDPLGRPLDGGPPVESSNFQPVERPAPAIIDRDFVSEPVYTGLLALDSMFALGRGQRELIIGDRAIGKTAIAVDCIINQKNSDIISVYVAVGQKSSTVKRVIEAIKSHGAPERCIFVIANASDAPGLQWLAPFSGMTMAEYFRDRGQHALVVIDDMTKHAATHREIALLTRQPPGREAFPGDVFYVHARLLERAAKLAKGAGGGSLTALPIAEINAGNLSAYIPTNLISITDGQIVLDSRLFQEGHKPAVDVGTSVSRVGGKAQAPALRETAETLRLDYAQFLELEMFTRFGGVTDTQVKGKIARGQRIRAALSQSQYAAMRLVDEVALVLALQSGLLDVLPLDNTAAFRSQLPSWLDRTAPAAVDSLARTGQFDERAKAQLSKALAELVSHFTSMSSEKTETT
jgi:F-type H+-transporting ATPase subunit alpha